MGTRFEPRIAPAVLRDHPHAYGDKSAIALSVDTLAGSSPRVWGQEHILCKSKKLDRIIPTRMGTSTQQGLIRSLTTDHPHAYGDKLIRSLTT